MRLSIIILFVCSLGATESLYAQPGKAKKIDMLKIAYLTKRLDLNEDQAKQFWPVYNNYQNELGALIREKRLSSTKRTKGPDTGLDDELTFESRILNLRKHYRNEFKRILPPEKIATLFKAEREFREQLIEELKQRRKK